MMMCFASVVLKGNMSNLTRSDYEYTRIIIRQPDFTQKRWTRIECAYIHSLQNIIRFLTGGELEFFYKSGKKKEHE